MTYGDKYDACRYSIYRFYRDIRRKADVGIQIGRLYPNVLDHVVLGDGGVNVKLIEEVAQSYLVDDAAASIQRFASRCLAADKSEMMVNALSQALIIIFGNDDPVPKPIIDVLLFYGAKLDPNDDDYFTTACHCSMNDDIKQAIENGRNVGEYDAHAAIISGNIDVIKLAVSAYRGSVRALSVEPINLLNATVQSMELLLSLNIIQRGKHSKFYNIPSFGVLQWILDHDVMKHDDIMLIDIAYNASRYSGHYFDILRYLIEQRNFTVPRDVLISMESYQISDLDVLDYLLLHGADVNAVEYGMNVLEHFPLLIRYWIDKGLAIQSIDANAMTQCVYQNMTAPVLEMMIDKYELNVNAGDKRGDTAIHEACLLNKYEVVEMLLHHGADVNKRNGWMKTSYDWTSDDRIKQLLIQYGYRV